MRIFCLLVLLLKDVFEMEFFHFGALVHCIGAGLFVRNFKLKYCRLFKCLILYPLNSSTRSTIVRFITPLN